MTRRRISRGSIIRYLESEIGKKDLENFVDYNIYRNSNKWNHKYIYLGFYATANGYHKIGNKPEIKRPMRAEREPNNKYDPNAIRMLLVTWIKMPSHMLQFTIWVTFITSHITYNGTAGSSIVSSSNLDTWKL